MTQLADMDSVEVTELQVADAGSSDASTPAVVGSEAVLMVVAKDDRCEGTLTTEAMTPRLPPSVSRGDDQSAVDRGDGGDRREGRGASTAEAATPQLPLSIAGGDDGGAFAKEVTTELADMDSVEVTDLEAADAGSSDASTAAGCRCRK